MSLKYQNDVGVHRKVEHHQQCWAEDERVADG